MSKSRYEGLQNELCNFSPVCCFFLTLLSIAEDWKADNKIEPATVDFIDALRSSRKNGWLGIDNMMYNDVKLLEYLTGAKVTKRVVTDPSGPIDVADDEYSAAKYRKGSNTHFRRRYFDVFNGSQTVAKGKLEAVYIYKIWR
jgi:hypothetical protein